MRMYFIGPESEKYNMKIVRIKVNGFKNICNADITFDKITSLLSVNSYGKSNLLNAIDFGITFISYNKKSNLIKWKPGIPLNKANFSTNFEFEIEFLIEKEQTELSVIYGYSFEWGYSKKKNQIISEYLKAKDLEDSQKFSTYLFRDLNVSQYRKSPTGRCDKDINIENDELIINKIAAYDDLFYLDIVKEINNVNVYIDRHLDSSDSYEPYPFIRKNIDELSLSDDKNIPRVLFNIRERFPNKFKLIVNTVSSIFPFIDDLVLKEIKVDVNDNKPSIADDEYFEMADRIYLLSAIDKTLVKSIPFSEMSDGVRRVLLLYTYIVLAQINHISLIAIEEPENSINPGLLKKYIIALDNFIDSAKILITSHSPFLINYVDPTTLYIGVPNDKGLALFRKIKDTSVNKLYKDAEDLDVLVGEYLFDLMSGTSDDLTTLNKYLINE
jgi:predicted ATPase